MFLSLDGRRIMANGVVSGASFQVPALEKADMRFGSSGALGEVRTRCQLVGLAIIHIF